MRRNPTQGLTKKRRIERIAGRWKFCSGDPYFSPSSEGPLMEGEISPPPPRIAARSQAQRSVYTVRPTWIGAGRQQAGAVRSATIRRKTSAAPSVAPAKRRPDLVRGSPAAIGHGRIARWHRRGDRAARAPVPDAAAVGIERCFGQCPFRVIGSSMATARKDVGA